MEYDWNHLPSKTPTAYLLGKHRNKIRIRDESETAPIKVMEFEESVILDGIRAGRIEVGPREISLSNTTTLRRICETLPSVEDKSKLAFKGIQRVGYMDYRIELYSMDGELHSLTINPDTLSKLGKNVTNLRIMEYSTEQVLKYGKTPNVVITEQGKLKYYLIEYRKVKVEIIDAPLDEDTALEIDRARMAFSSSTALDAVLSDSINDKYLTGKKISRACLLERGNELSGQNEVTANFGAISYTKMLNNNFSLCPPRKYTICDTAYKLLDFLKNRMKEVNLPQLLTNNTGTAENSYRIMRYGPVEIEVIGLKLDDMPKTMSLMLFKVDDDIIYSGEFVDNDLSKIAIHIKRTNSYNGKYAKYSISKWLRPMDAIDNSETFNGYDMLVYGKEFSHLVAKAMKILTIRAINTDTTYRNATLSLDLNTLDWILSATIRENDKWREVIIKVLDYWEISGVGDIRFVFN